MPELRQNIVTKEWVIIANERSKRPDEYIQPHKHITTETRTFFDPTCPFCPGNEELDLEIECFPATGPWQTRVVCNKYPALSREGELTRTFDGVHRRISGIGYHEIEVEIRTVSFFYPGWPPVKVAMASPAMRPVRRFLTQ